MKLRAFIGPGAGALVVLSGFAHAFLGWPHMHMDLHEAGAGPALIGALAALFAFWRPS